jgi:heme/copper-type cytochrome/quinol oxidase subunit 2
MDSQVDNLWLIANILGAVVVLVVAALLTLLVIFVARIRKRVDMIKATLVSIKENTADTALITTTAGGVELVLAEGLEHHLFLGRVLDKVRS